MPKYKLLIASDLHLSVNLQAEMAAMEARLPPGEYDHLRDGRLFWHNELLVEQMALMLDALNELATAEEPDLLLFLGDLVNTNWVENVAALAAKVQAFNCPIEAVTGNHDIYLAEPAARVQAALQPSAFSTGLRCRLWADWGLIFLDLFARDRNGGWNKWLDLTADPITIDYRPEDIRAVQALLDAHPEQRFLVCGHFPMCAPAEAIRQPGRKIGINWRGGAQLAQRLHEPNNLIGIVCGHQHFAHLQHFTHGFHWTLPALVESPCAAAIVELDGPQVTGRLVQPLPALAQQSLSTRRQSWTSGRSDEQRLSWPLTALKGNHDE